MGVYSSNIAIGVLIFVAVLCIHLVIALYKRSTRRDEWDAERDEEDNGFYAADVKLQLQQELQDAVQTSDSNSEKEPLLPSPSHSTQRVRFAVDEDDGVHSPAYGREQGLRGFRGSPINVPYTNGIQIPVSSPQKVPMLHLPSSPNGSLEDNEPTTVFVNAKQYARILKRRLARQLLDEYLQSKPKSPNVFMNGCMRRPRNPKTGRFLTLEEISRLENGDLASAAS